MTALGLVFLLYVYPVILTVFNLGFVSGTEKKRYDKRQSYTKGTLIYGSFLFNIALFFISYDLWDDRLTLRSYGVIFDQLFSSDFYFLFLIIEVISVISIIQLDRPKIMSPALTLLCVCGTYAGFFTLILYGFDIFKIVLHLNDWFASIVFVYMWIYIINFYLCAARVLGEAIRDYRKNFRESDMSLRSALSRNIAHILSNVSGWFIFPIICMIPLIEQIAVLSLICR